MKCPTDSATLVMSERGGVEIDYCPECRGVWLDRGELDKIIDRAEKEFAAAAPAAPVVGAIPQQPYPVQQPRSSQPGDRGYDDRDRDNRDRDRDNRDRDNRDRDNRDGYRPKKRENWLGELFG
ncbi:MAG: zf-TFIIB domain-containing protein [Cryobacterium sp.]|uniref:TFIIB-type zinc ribbon-containing protein n=1 Tax=unclassified Cryobacterium TaxID=2649013 RepID=UPI0018C8D8CC|nr:MULTISPECIES: zf-TFIIB domain-containing protein [unclassified Cryobacterium]MCY7403113.1 zf-TFIIB domain-containing protein [Cryobacterium sp.]MEC5152805.1 Zn-finger nucleic acid-binding protein [Cryobacterium sp. CAN_C3]